MRAIAACVLFLCFLAPAAWAQYDDDRPYDDRYGTDPYAEDSGAGRFSIRTGLGFTADPDGFLLGFEGDYAFTEHLSTGVLLQLGLDDDRTIVSPVVYGRFRSDLGGIDPALEPLEPYIHLGFGITYWHVDRRPPRSGTTDDVEFLLNPGVGIEYRFTDHVSAGTHMMFNIIPAEIFGERFYFSWEVLTLRYRF